MRVVVLGAGGFGRETLDVIEAAVDAGTTELRTAGVVDDHPSALALERLWARGVRYLGTIDEWLAGLEPGDETRHLIGVGHPVVRRKLDERLTAAGRLAATVVHPSASVGSQVVLGEGSVVCGGVQVSTNVHLGRHVHLNPNATVGHDARLDDFVSVNPAATVSGECRIREATLLGAASVVLQGLTVGERATVGAAACVVRDVPGGETVKGVPAR